MSCQLPSGLQPANNFVRKLQLWTTKSSGELSPSSGKAEHKVLAIASPASVYKDFSPRLLVAEPVTSPRVSALTTPVRGLQPSLLSWRAVGVDDSSTTGIAVTRTQTGQQNRTFWHRGRSSSPSPSDVQPVCVGHVSPRTNQVLQVAHATFRSQSVSPGRPMQTLALWPAGSSLVRSPVSVIKPCGQRSGRTLNQEEKQEQTSSPNPCPRPVTQEPVTADARLSSLASPLGHPEVSLPGSTASTEHLLSSWQMVHLETAMKHLRIDMETLRQENLELREKVQEQLPKAKRSSSSWTESTYGSSNSSREIASFRFRRRFAGSSGESFIVPEASAVLAPRAVNIETCLPSSSMLTMPVDALPSWVNAPHLKANLVAATEGPATSRKASNIDKADDKGVSRRPDFAKYTGSENVARTALAKSAAMTHVSQTNNATGFKEAFPKVVGHKGEQRHHVPATSTKTYNPTLRVRKLQPSPSLRQEPARQRQNDELLRGFQSGEQLPQEQVLSQIHCDLPHLESCEVPAIPHFSVVPSTERLTEASVGVDDSCTIAPVPRGLNSSTVATMANVLRLVNTGVDTVNSMMSILHEPEDANAKTLVGDCHDRSISPGKEGWRKVRRDIGAAQALEGLLHKVRGDQTSNLYHAQDWTLSGGNYYHVPTAALEARNITDVRTPCRRRMMMRSALLGRECLGSLDAKFVATDSCGLGHQPQFSQEIPASRDGQSTSPGQEGGQHLRQDLCAASSLSGLLHTSTGQAPGDAFHESPDCRLNSMEASMVPVPAPVISATTPSVADSICPAPTAQSTSGQSPAALLNTRKAIAAPSWAATGTAWRPTEGQRHMPLAGASANARSPTLTVLPWGGVGVGMPVLNRTMRIA